MSTASGLLASAPDHAVSNEAPGLSWFGIFRLGLVQTALGAIVVLTTSTMNRVMVVELALPAMLPGLLVALHYVLQVLRPRWGYGSDLSGRRSPWILGGIAVLASGGWLAAYSTATMGTHLALGIALAVVAFVLIGLGVGASGTSLLALLAREVAPRRRPAAATVVWVMMIMGFVITAGTAGHFLDPYSPERLMQVSGAVSAIAVVLSALALTGVETRPAMPGVSRGIRAGTSTPSRAREASAHGVADHHHASSIPSTSDRTGFVPALREVWSEPASRRFALFVFVSMLAYSAQDLILEPFAGTVFGMTPGQSTQLSGVQHAGVLLGMVALALLGTWQGSGESPEGMRGWTVAGCMLSALMLGGLAAASLWGPGWPLQASVFALGVANGLFAVAAIGSMMTLAGRGTASREGLRMGLWGAAQALAFGLGGFLGTAASDLAQFVLGDPVAAYACVFATEAALFLAAAAMAVRGVRGRADSEAAVGAGAGAGAAVAAAAEAGAGAALGAGTRAAHPHVPGLAAGLGAGPPAGRGNRTTEEKHT